MARTSRAEACIFCMSTPCECNGPAKKKSAKRKLEPKPKPVAEATNLIPDSASDLDFTAPEAGRSRFKATGPTDEPAKTQDELELEQAIKNLGPLLDSAEVARQRHILNPPLTTKQEREVIEWRRRNGKG